jgi:hypothetical protein
VITGRVIAVIFGTVLVMSVLISALETVVLPRNGFTRITRCVFAVADRILIHRWRNSARQDNLRALYAPIALVSLPLVWMISVCIGFTFVFWGIEAGTWARSFEVSGSSLFTLGFAEPPGSAKVLLTFIEATIGLGLVALLISYLPTIYSAHNERDKGINVLRPFAGSPPSPIDLLANLQRLGNLDSPDLWQTVSSWLLELDQTHTAFPALCYFPESSPDLSWTASVGSLLDAAALLLSTSDLTARDDTLERVKGPMMAVAYGMPSLVRIGMSVGLPIQPSAMLHTLVGKAAEEPPAVSVTKTEYLEALDRLDAVLTVPEDQRETCWRRFAWIRSGYDRALRGLAGLTMAPAAEWTTDRPARVGRPRLIGRKPIRVEWGPDAAGPLRGD